MWTFDPSEIAEQTLIRDFNRNNMMLLKKYILFSRLNVNYCHIPGSIRW